MCRRWGSNPHEVALTGFFESVTELPCNPHRYHQSAALRPLTPWPSRAYRGHISQRTKPVTTRSGTPARADCFLVWVLARKLMHTCPLTVSPEPHSEKRLTACFIEGGRVNGNRHARRSPENGLQCYWTGCPYSLACCTRWCSPSSRMGLLKKHLTYLHRDGSISLQRAVSGRPSGARGHEQIRQTFFNLESGWRELLLRICPRRRRRRHARLG